MIIKYSRAARRYNFDCFVALDCSDLQRPGRVSGLNNMNKPVLNIDHHVSNAYFGTVNWIEPHASCTCELIWQLYKKLKLPIDKDAAEALYAGLLTDTGSFRYTNTTARTHLIAAELVATGIDVAAVYKNIYANIPYDDLKLLFAILPTMQRSAGGKIAWFEIRKGLVKRNQKIHFDLSDNILNFGRCLKGVEVVVLFKENASKNGTVRINFRSQGLIDVNAIARAFGGGGHRTASGANVSGTLAQVRGRVIASIKKAINACHKKPE